MTHIKRSALVPFSADKLYDLVNAIETYPEFLPWCSDAKILESSPDVMLASVTIAGGGFSKTFTTRNELVPHEKIIMRHVDGPFRSLTGEWRFVPLSNEGCRVELDMHFEVESGVKGMLFGVVFNKIADKLVDAFCERAKELYAND